MADIGPCVIGVGTRTFSGHLQSLVYIGPRPARYWLQAHREAFSQAWGITLTPGQVVRHTCDNPPCVNPLHLQVGSLADNNRDRYTPRRVA